MSEDKIVITGISGKFPNSENVKSFQKNLLNMVDCVTEDNPRWIWDHPNIPKRIGKMKDVTKFDSLAFGIYSKFADNMDPMVRLIMECTYEAIADAGINPRQMKEKKCAVFTGTNYSETEKSMFLDSKHLSGWSLLGIARTMIANRISFFLGVQGPSINIDSACTGSGSALEKAYLAIKSGEVESAIVGTANVILHPHTSLQLFNLGLLSPDGVTKSFDEKADGYTRSESVVVLFLQRARDAKRIYAEIKNVHSITGPSYNRLSVFYPTSDFQKSVMKMTLEESGLFGKDISFVEADGMGIKEADAEEIEAIDQVYNEGRHTPLLIGSVKSNVGSCSAANTLISIIKVITMMETGYIPPNLHYECPSEKIPAIKEGRIQVVTEKTLWKDDYVAINTTSMGGGCSSVILKSFKKEKKSGGQPDDDFPRLVVVSGPNEEAVASILDNVESRPVDTEMLQLLNDIFEVETPSHLYRGYMVLPPRGIVNSKIREIQYASGEPKEIWYVFSGMGSQWVGMGEAFMKLPVFAEAVRKCDAVLKLHGIDIVRILTEKDPKMFDNIINSFVGIATVQIGLVDLLTYFGIQPDFIIGHSVGELGCAYADGCLTAEQMVLSALSRGLASVESNLLKGSMAAVGLGYEDIQPLCPPDIDVACHNSSINCTISGPEDSMKKFVASLKAEGIFAVEVACSNIAFHSRYIAPAGQKLREYLEKEIPVPKPRSSRWISTSVPENEWGTARTCFSSAEYHTNNLLSPVLFSEASKKIPANAIAIEIAPHGLLQAIVKKSLPETVINIPLTKRGHPNNIEFMMAAFGKLYIAGYKADLSKLYPKVNYPVSRGTPSISSMIRWDHKKDWLTYFYKNPSTFKKGEMKFEIDLSNETWKFLRGNKIENKVFFPCSLYLKLAWLVYEQISDKTKEPIMFENVLIHKNQYITEEDTVMELIVMVQKGSGSFEVTFNETLLCSGTLRKMDSLDRKRVNIPNKLDCPEKELSSSDVYRELQMRGHQYSGSFKSIFKASTDESDGYLMFQEEWITFLDGMFQMYVFKNNVQTTQIPVKIRKIIVDLQQYQKQSQNSCVIPVMVDQKLNVVHSVGVEIQGIKLMPIVSNSCKGAINIEEFKIVPNADGANLQESEIFNLILQLLIENITAANVIRIIKSESNNCARMQEAWEKILKETLETKYHVDVASTTWLEENESKNSALMVFSDIATFKKVNLSNILSEGDFLLTFVDCQEENAFLNTIQSLNLGIVLKKRSSTNQLAILFRKKRILRNTCILEIKDGEITNQMKEKINYRLYDRIVLSARQEDGINQIEILDKLSGDLNGKRIKSFEILDDEAPKLSLEDALYRKHLQLDLNFNILTPERVWGTRRRIPVVQKRHEVTSWIASQTHLGDLGSIDWVEQSYDDVTTSNLVKVEYSTINESDILLASGAVTSYLTNGSQDNKRIKLGKETFGLEYSGIDAKGTRVMGISETGTLSSFTTLDSEYMWEIPKGWTLAEAVTVPLAYAAAYLAIYLKGDIQKKQSVLIYDGTCPFGQAAINLALSEECEIFTTYRTEEENKFLKLQYPSINEDHLFCSKDPFEDLILSSRKGAEVDLVIYNSSNLKKIESCLRRVKNKARVIVLGNLQGVFNESVGMEIFLKEVNMYSIIPKKLIGADLSTKRKLASMIKSGLRSGVIKPLSSNTYLRDELRNAFNDSARKKVYGKVVIKVQPEDSRNKASIIPCFSCSNKGSYLIIEGMSNFGLKLIDFLIARGAKNILVASATENSKAFYNYHTKMWHKCGATVILREDLDFSELQNLKALLKEARKLGPIDAIFDLQRIEKSSQRSSYSKYLFTKNLDEESGKVCTNLRKFVVCSTSNDAEEDLNHLLLRENNVAKLCEERSKSGSQTLLILWGPMEGVVQSKSCPEKEVSLLTIPECINQLDNLLSLDSRIVAVSKNKSMVNRTMQKRDKIHNAQEKDEAELFKEYLYSLECSSSTK